MRTTILIPLLGLALLTECATAPVSALLAAESATPTPTKTAESTVRSVFGNAEVAISEEQGNEPSDFTDPNWFSCTSDLLGYSDVNAAAQVTITDAAGTVIGIGELGAGEPGYINGTSTCKFPIVVEDVPLDGDVFGVQIEGPWDDSVRAT